MGGVKERRLIRTTGTLFIIGSALFALGVPLSFPTAWPPLISAITYAVGAVFFTAAATCQLVLAQREIPEPETGTAGSREPWRLLGLRAKTTDWLAAAVQLVGTVLFNVNTIDAALTLHARPDLQNEAVWVPDTTGSIAFLVSSVLAFAPEVRARRHSHVLANSWWIAAINLAGSVLFGVSAAAAYVLRNGHDVSLVWANIGTFFGALCFLVAAAMFGFPRERAAKPRPASGTSPGGR